VTPWLSHGRWRERGIVPASPRTSYNPLMFSVYMVRCADGTLYTGFARDPLARVRVHNSGKGAKYTRARLPVTLVYWSHVTHAAPR